MSAAVYVYRCYAGERLLYVGQSKNVLVRWRQHMFEHTWWAERVTYWSVEVYPNREAARIAERDAIEHEHPVHNGQHFGAPTRARWSQQQYVDYVRGRLEVPYVQHSSDDRSLPAIAEEYARRFGRSLRADVGRVRAGRRWEGDDRTSPHYREWRRLA